MKRLFPLMALLLATLLASCDGASEVVGEYANWATRNKTAFADTLRLAQTAIAKAKSEHGEQWEQHCNWRVLHSYKLPPAATAGDHQKVVVRIVERGTGSGMPLHSDTVQVNYVGRLMPTPEHPEGLSFDHSGNSSHPQHVFSPHYSYPTQFAVSSLVDGFTTALQHMHIGDRWRIFIPAEMGYGTTASPKIPSHSMLLFDLQLRAYWRAGFAPIKAMENAK